MKRSITRRALILLPLACAALYGCPQEETHEEGEFADVIYGGKATDEALVSLGGALDQKEPISDPARAPVLDAPAEAALPKSPIPEFSWHFGDAASLRSPVRPSRGSRERPELLRFAEAPPSWLDPLASLVGAPRAAHAHGDPLNGTATFLVFSTKDDPKLVRVFTDLTTFTPDQETWDEMIAAGAPITLSLVAADFDNNRIADGGEPVQGTKLELTIEP